jgi:aminoglycoside 6'-N-acetyltransferase
MGRRYALPGAGGLGHLVVARDARAFDRAKARVGSRRLDRALADGAPAEDTPALALRARRLIALPCRRSIAESYRRIVRDADEGGSQSRARVAPSRGQVAVAGGELVRLARSLARPGPVAPRGVAQALLLLADGTGPLYNPGSDASLQECAASAIGNLAPSTIARPAQLPRSPDVTISFRPLERGDFQELGDWLAEPLVARWWHHAHQPAAVERDFGPSVDGSEATQIFITLAEGQPFGLIQRYRIDHYPEYREELSAVWPMPPGALGIDYLIGVPELRGRGLGSRMIAAFVKSSWEGLRDAPDFVAAVAAENRASWRALERAGFHRVAAGELTPDNPRHGRDHFVYHRRQHAGASAST